MEWYEENGKHLGFIDGTFLYRVAKDENGWYWEFVPDMDGFDGYNTAEEAMADAMADANEHGWLEESEEKEEEPLSYEEAMEVLGDMMYDERKEEGLF